MTSCPCSSSRFVMPLPMRPRPTMPSCIPASPLLLDVDTRDPAAALLERLEIACGLCADQLPEPERLPGDRKLLACLVDDLKVEPGGRAALVQLARRMQVARTEPVRDDATCRRTRLVGECEHPGLVRRRRVDECLNADVIALLRLRIELLRRALRRNVRRGAAREHLARLVLRGLHVRLVE